MSTELWIDGPLWPLVATAQWLIRQRWCGAKWQLMLKKGELDLTRRWSKGYPYLIIFPEEGDLPHHGHEESDICRSIRRLQFIGVMFDHIVDSELLDQHFADTPAVAAERARDALLTSTLCAQTSNGLFPVYDPTDKDFQEFRDMWIVLEDARQLKRLQDDQVETPEQTRRRKKVEQEYAKAKKRVEEFRTRRALEIAHEERRAREQQRAQ